MRRCLEGPPHQVARPRHERFACAAGVFFSLLTGVEERSVACRRKGISG